MEPQSNNEIKLTTGLVATIYHADKQRVGEKAEALRLVEVESRLEQAKEMLHKMEQKVASINEKIEKAEQRFLQLQRAALELQKQWHQDKKESDL